MLDNPNDIGRGALAVTRQTAPGLAVTVAAAPSTHSKADETTAAQRGLFIEETRSEVDRLQYGLHLHDLRALSWAERGAISDRELDALIDRDVPGALSEFSLREWLRRHPTVERGTIKPHCAP